MNHEDPNKLPELGERHIPANDRAATPEEIAMANEIQRGKELLQSKEKHAQTIDETLSYFRDWRKSAQETIRREGETPTRIELCDKLDALIVLRGQAFIEKDHEARDVLQRRILDLYDEIGELSQRSLMERSMKGREEFSRKQ